MAATGALAAEKRLQIIPNYMANVSTAGFKKTAAVSSRLISLNGLEKYSIRLPRLKPMSLT